MKDEDVKKTSGMRANCVEDLSADYYQLGIQKRKQLAKEIIHKGRGPWISIAFKYQSQRENNWEPARVMLAFFKNMGGIFTRYSYFNIRSKEEALKIIRFLMNAFDIQMENIQ